MIQIEKVSNGFILRIEEQDEDTTIVCQREFNYMNMGLLAVFKQLCDRWQEDGEPQIKLDLGG
jgi:hypothetical protein